MLPKAIFSPPAPPTFFDIHEVNFSSPSCCIPLSYHTFCLTSTVGACCGILRGMKNSAAKKIMKIAVVGFGVEGKTVAELERNELVKNYYLGSAA